jgi:hypothetical protein
MLERYLTALRIDDAPAEDIAATRERLKDRFPRGSTRRMTQLGLMLGSVLEPLFATPADTLVYASEFGESRTLEAYLESFPTASPTLFQTSIHPSGVQQLLIGRQQHVREFFPMTGRAHLVARALQTALLAPGPRAIVCGGEERGTWLFERGAASARSFAFALTLSSEPRDAFGKLTLSPSADAAGELALVDFFDALAQRRGLELAPAPGLRLSLSWS